MSTWNVSEAESLTSAQHRPCHREARSWALAVLSRAIEDYLNVFDRCKGRDTERAGEEASDWFFSHKPSGYVFSFPAVCAILDLPPEKLRGRLRRICSKKRCLEVRERLRKIQREEMLRINAQRDANKRAAGGSQKEW